MATKSVLKTVRLHGRRECVKFIRALEKSEEALIERKTESERIRARDLDKDAIRKVFETGEAK